MQHPKSTLIAIVSSTCLSGVAFSADVPTVTADTPPVHALVSSVMGDIGTPNLMIEGVFDPHHFTLKPSVVRKITNSDLFVWIGPSMTPWLEDVVDNLNPQTARLELLNVSGLPLMKIGEIKHDDHGHDDHGHEEGHDEHEHEEEHDEHGHEEGHDEHGHEEEHDEHGHEEEHDEHGKGGVDPHAWLDPHIAQLWLMAIAEELAMLDPKNADQYRANAKKEMAALENLEAELKEMLDPEMPIYFMSDHYSYAYFARAFDVTYLGGIGDQHDHAPTPKRLRKLHAAAQEYDKICVIAETPEYQKFYTQMLSKEQYSVYIINPLGTDLTPGVAQYQTLLRNLAGKLKDCAS